MKRAPSDSASPPSSPVITPKYERRDTDDEYAPSDPPTPTPSSQKRAHQTPKKQRTENRGLASAKKVLTSKNDWEPGWTPDKKEAIIDEILNAGLKAISQTELCRKFNLTKAQLSNALQSGHKNNLRDKAAKGVRQ